MAHIKKENKAQPMNDYAIYVILSPLQKNYFFVNYTGLNRIEKAYIEHYNLRVKKTKDMFSAAKELDLLPPIYLLEDVHTTRRDAFKRCIAWTKYFLSQGYSQITEDVLRNYSDDMSSDTEHYFNQIKELDITQVLQPDGGLFPQYGSRYKRTGEKKSVGFYLTADEYVQLKNAAEESEMSLSAYCKNMCLNGRIVKADLSFIGEYVNMFNDYKTFMRHLLFTINRTGKYYPADLRNIQEGIDKLIEIQAEVSEKSINLIRSLREEE